MAGATDSQMVGVMPFPETLWGGNGGDSFDDGIHVRVAGFTLTMGAGVQTIAFTYEKGPSPTHGSLKGATTVNIKFKDDETLLGISGYYGQYHNNNVVTSLTFQTNKQAYGPYGTGHVPDAKTFVCTPAGCEIVGFFGRSGHFIDAIGVWFKLTLTCIPLESVITLVQAVVNTLQSDEWKPLPSPSWGGQDGIPWADGIQRNISKIEHGTVINTIQFEYIDSKGERLSKVKHGSHDGSKKDTINLNHPGEYLQYVSGTYGQFGSLVVVKSLTFHTNSRKFGPYGSSGESFLTPTTGCKILGFFGRSGHHLDSIGFHVVTNQVTSQNDIKAGWE